MSRSAINPTRAENFSEWYHQVIQAADLAENAPVRGCMTLKPYGYAIWENIQKILDARLKKIGVQNAYFPLLIPIELLSKEAEHIEGFAKECAVVTHHRLKKDGSGNLVPDGALISPYVIRPTSEVIVGSTVSKWINTYRDLPMKLNQWCNVMRWEMRTRMFLRTSEFLWQEGHTIFETAEEAHADALKVLELYHHFITEDLAMPGIVGKKTSEEKFPGAVETYTIEVMMQDGKALQAATSHYLGQTFAKAFDIKYLGRDNAEHCAYTSSWGLSTRIIGGIIMSHGDDDGLVLPPQVAPYQVVIIPIENKENNAAIRDYAHQIQERLSKAGISTYIDLSENSNANKIWKWIKRGAPIRITIGNNELLRNDITLSRRDLGKDSKITMPFDSLMNVVAILDEITANMRKRARSYSEANIKEVANLRELEALFANDARALTLLNVSETNSEEFPKIAQQYSLTRRCIPLHSSGEEQVLVGRAY